MERKGARGRKGSEKRKGEAVHSHKFLKNRLQCTQRQKEERNVENAMHELPVSIGCGMLCALCCLIASIIALSSFSSASYATTT